MGNFNEIVPRRINIYPARKATLAEAENAPVPFDKYYRIKPTRQIKKLDTYFILPATTVPLANVRIIGDFLFQFNVTAPEPFYILNQIRRNNDLTSILTVKWRIGKNVFRYFIEGEQVFNMLGIYGNVQSFIPYSDQLIPTQCVFEVWCGALNFNVPPVNVGLLSNYKIHTSMTSDPIDTDSVELDLPVSLPIFRANNAVAFPIALPIINRWANIVWNSN